MKKKTYNKRTKEPIQQSLLKPRLIMVGSHLINPLDISSVSKVKVRASEYEDNDTKGSFFNRESREERYIYIVKMISNPNSTYPLWVKIDAIGALLNEFEIIEG